MDDLLRLRGRTVAVAGAGGGGIGTAICRMLATAGAAVVAIDVDPGRLAMAVAAVEDAGGRVEPVVADVCDAAGVERALGAAVALGHLHGMVHVAGGMSPEQWAPLVEMTPDTFDDVVRLNLSAAFLTTRAFGARLAEQGGGSIVHIASISGMSAMPFGVPYAAAKAGMLALMRTAALELGHAGVRVNAVAPGTIRTAKNVATSPPEDTAEERTAIPLGRRGRGDDIAGAVLYLLSDLASFVSGHALVVDGGSSARPSYLDADDLPVFVHDPVIRERLRRTE